MGSTSALDDGALRDPRPLRKGLESDLRPKRDAAERVDVPAELAVDEGNELGGIVLDRGERAVRAGVSVECGEHDTVPIGGEQVGDCPVVPPREAAPVQEHRRPRARVERVSDHLDPFDGDIAWPRRWRFPRAWADAWAHGSSHPVHPIIRAACGSFPHWALDTFFSA